MLLPVVTNYILQLRSIYLMISSWHKLSGVHWDNNKGANIEGPATQAVFNTFIAQKVHIVQ